MNIVFLTQTLPFPFDKNGFTVPISRWIKGIASRGNNVDLIYLDNEEYINKNEVKKNLLINNIYYFKSPNKIKNNIYKIISLLQKYPTFIWNSYDNNIGKEIEKIIKNNKYDIAILAGIQISNYYKHFGSLKKILVDLDSHYLLYKRRYEKAKGLNKLGFRIQLQKIRSFETKLYKKYHARILLSEFDRKIAQKLDPNIKTYIVPLGTEVSSNENYNKIELHNEQTFKIIFVGNLSYFPNEEAVIFFAKEVLPELIKKHNNILFKIVGKNPSDKILALESKNIIVTGEVPDVSPYYAEADLVVAPLLTGSGIKNKVLEAMAHKKCVVTTEIGVEGLDVENYKDLIWCESKKDMIEAINKVINNKKLREEIALGGFKKVKSQYSWDISIEKFINTIELIISQ